MFTLRTTSTTTTGARKKAAEREGQFECISGYYDGPRDTKDPEEAFPYWKNDDSTLSLRCVSQTVRIDSRLVPDPSRASMLRKLYRRTGRLIRSKCGPPLVRGKLNMDTWLVDVKCGGDCHRTDIAITLDRGRVSLSVTPRHDKLRVQADLLVVAAQSDLDLQRYCFRCHPHWSGRLLAGEVARWATSVRGLNFRMYVIVVGYDDYVALNLNIDSVNIIAATAHKLK